MKYRELGKTGLKVSEVGFGGEMLEKASPEAVAAVVRACEERGINILDCWMPYPDIRTNLGKALEGHRDQWIIQGHFGATCQDGQYVKTRDMTKVIPAFEDLMIRLNTTYLDLGMIHYVDDDADYDEIFNGLFLKYVLRLKEKGIIRHIGLSTHNPRIAKRAAMSGIVEMIMFSINPAFDMMPPTENIDDYFEDKYDANLGGQDKERAELYQLCESRGIGITVMKGFGGGRLFDAKTSPFGVALTPVQCLHYALTRPAVASVLVGYTSASQVHEAAEYENATDEQKDYATVLANAPEHKFGAECMYCGHCLPCPQGIDIATANKFYDLAVSYDEIPESIHVHYLDMNRNAHDCIGCGGCETRCPFGVKIVDKMNKAREIFPLRDQEQGGAQREQKPSDTSWDDSFGSEEPGVKFHRPIRELNIALAIVLSIVTCGLYSIYWMVRITEDMIEINNEKTSLNGLVCVILNICTCGLFGMYWSFKMGRYSTTNPDNEILYGVLGMICYMCGFGIVTMAIAQNRINTYAREWA